MRLQWQDRVTWGASRDARRILLNLISFLSASLLRCRPWFLEWICSWSWWVRSNSYNLSQYPKCRHFPISLNPLFFKFLPLRRHYFHPTNHLHPPHPMYASTLLLLLSLRCLTFHTPYSQHPRAPCTTASAEYGRRTVIPLSYFLTAPRIFFKPQKLFPSLLLLLLCGDISLNPGPVTASHFNLCTLNIRSLLNEKHYTALHDLVSSSNHRPDAIALTETWITSSATNSQLFSCRPDGYSLISSPRQPKNSSKSSTSNLGGGIAFLIREPATVLA